MATLHITKGYGLQERKEALLDASRDKLNAPTPHQAPQRERVSLAGIPASAQEKRATRRRKQKPWKECLRPDYNMGVPQLMQILEPNIVWDHVQAFNAVLSKEVEAKFCPGGGFFDGWHKGGRPAHGVYEGSYWELIGDCEQLQAMLEKLSQAPELLEEPVLDLPETADLPSWDDFKPVLQALPSAPNLPLLRLPPLRPPILDTEVPFIEPQYETVPEVPDASQEEALPIFFPPEELQAEEWEEPEYEPLEAPIVPHAPQAPVFGKPQYGHDWTGTRPFTVPLVPYQAPQLLTVPNWIHPPRDLPKLPDLDDLSLDEAHLDLEPLPRLELAWEAGPEPEPAYASVATTPRTLSRPLSPARSLTPPHTRPSSAGPFSSPPPTGASTRPGSAAPRRPSGGSSSPPPEPANPPNPASALPYSLNHLTSIRDLNSTMKHRIPFPSLPSHRPLHGPDTAPPDADPTPSPPAGAEGQRASGTGARLASDQGGPSDMKDWASVSDIDAGKPRLWLNYDTPFAELPPIFMPPEPVLGVCNGPEPDPGQFPVGDLEDVPAFALPKEKAVPVWEPTPLKAPAWCPPCEPRPIGFMRGTAPVLILDVSGTMNPRQRGKFPTMKECACEMLDAQGELATAAGAFDVIAFCNGAWSWSATYAQRLSMLASSQLMYSGRQVGGKIIPGSAVDKKTKHGAVLMPTETELLEDARNWVDKWPEAIGHTSLLTALLMADEHWNADCWYILSDGLADDPMQCMHFIEARIRHGQRVPVVHTVSGVHLAVSRQYIVKNLQPDECSEAVRKLSGLGHKVGFFPDDVTPNFEGRRFLQNLSALTGGTFQEFDPSKQRIYQEGVGFVDYDIKVEPQDIREEREWAEEALRSERRKNMRLGIAERLEVTLARVQALHHQMRIQPKLKEYQEQLAMEQAAYEAALADVADYNDNLHDRAQAQYQAEVDAITARNQQKIAAAKAAYEEAHRQWVAMYEQAVQEWNQLKEQREEEQQNAQDTISKDRADALAKYAALQAARSRTPSPPLSRPSSARPTTSNSGRPTSARLPPPAPSSATARPSSATPMRSRPSAGTNTAPDVVAKHGDGPQDDGSAAKKQAGATLAAADAHAWALSEVHMPAGVEAGVVAPLASRLAQASGGYNRQQSILELAIARAASPRDASAQQGLQPAAATASQNTSSSGASRPASSTSRPSSARPSSSNQRRSATATYATNSGAYMISSQAVASQLQQLLEEGEDEEVPVEGQPSRLSDLSDPLAAAARPGLQDEAYDGFDLSGLGSRPGLELEHSQELKRRIFPPEVVQALDDSNEARLADIRSQWAALLHQVEQRNRAKLHALACNKDKLQQYEDAVIAAYADSFIKDAIYGAAVRITVNDRIIKTAEAAYEAERARVAAENERLAAAHQQEVEDKQFKEERHKQALLKWEADKVATWQQHEREVQASKVAHEENQARLREEWDAHKEEVRHLNEVRLSEAQAQHTALVEEVAVRNRQARADHAEKLKARKAVEASNLERLAEARAQHQQALTALALDNEAKMQQAHEEHKALCARLEKEHAEAVEAAHREFAELKGFLTAHNEGLLEEARKRFAEAVAAAQAEYATLCEQLRGAWSEEMARVTAHNQAIWPQVQRARIALAELGRVQAFGEHIRYCANKMQLGVNYLPNTPNYDRVVEMQALNEALVKAFPDYPKTHYPWPGHEERLKPGTGWVTSPAPPVLDLKDPAIEVYKAVQATGFGKKPSTAAARAVSARPASSPAIAQHSTLQVMRPGSANRQRFSGIVSSQQSATNGPVDNLMQDVQPGSNASGQAEMWEAGGGYSVVQSTNSQASLSMSSRPATPLHQMQGTPPQTAPGSLAGSPRPRPTTAAVRAMSQTRALSAGPTVTNTMASAPSMAGGGNRPASPAALGKGLGAAQNQACLVKDQNRPVSARPASARMPVPARMSAELQAMQVAISKYRTPKMFAAPQVQQRKVQQQKSLLGGKFRTDCPRVLWPDVDVKALDY